jgi:hypothetical protein
MNSFFKKGDLSMCEDLNIKNYVNGNYPVCREERQYALYLSNVLRYYGKNPKNKTTNRIGDNEEVKNIFKACGFNDVDLKNIVIENVYYEATFMRDFFERNRRYYLAKDKTHPEVEYSKNPFKHEDYMVSINNSFNCKLLGYCSDIINNTQDNTIQDKTPYLIEKPEDRRIAERNYGGNNNFIGELKPKKTNLEDEKLKLLNEGGLKLLKEINVKKVDEKYIEKNPEGFEKWNKFKTLVRAMMNAKPDLAVIYYNSKEKGLRKLLFIECKYCSNEDCYEYDGYNKYDDKGIIKVAKKPLWQTEVQGYIADFLCKSYLKDYVEMSEIMRNNNNESKKVRFVPDPVKDEERKTQKGQTEEGKINIKDLIELEEDIFNK